MNRILRLQLLLLQLLATSACERSTGQVVAALMPGLIQPPEALDEDPAADRIRVTLIAEATAHGYTYSGSSPGPTIVGRVGDYLEVQLINRLDAPTTIHWHGLTVPVSEDGVAPLVGPGERRVYRFPLTHAGTFWYHPHFDTAAQVDRGLYGMLVVKTSDQPALPELVLIFDQPLEQQVHDEPPAHGHGQLVERWQVNGVAQPKLALPGGSVVRARVLNASNYGYLDLRLPNLGIIAKDQGLLPGWDPEPLILGPGDRAELELRVGPADFEIQTNPYTLNGGARWGEPQTLLTVIADPPAPLPKSADWPFMAAPSPPDPGATDIVYAFAGSDRIGHWLINGQAFPNITPESVAVGSRPIIELVNVSPTEHPFHTHGSHFEILSIDGVAPPFRRVEDTLNVKIGQKVRLRLLADVPGEWMVHCHILPHAEEGMMTMLRIE